MKQLYNISSQSILRSHCNVSAAILLHHLSKKSHYHFQSSNHGWKHNKNVKQFCKLLNSSARERKYTQAWEASDVNNTCSSSIAGDKLHVSFVASSQTHSYQPFMPSCKANICTQSYLILTLTNELSCLL